MSGNVLPSDDELVGDLPVADFIRFLESTQKSDECPHCGHNDWVVNSSPPSGGLIEIAAVQSLRHDRALPVATVNCTTCGLVKMFTIEVARKWLAKQP